MPMQATGYWIFVSNPKQYPIDAHMRDYLPLNGGISTWSVRKSMDFKSGDLGLVRVGVDARNKSELARDGADHRLASGIYGLCAVLGEPSDTLVPVDHDRWTEPRKKDAPSIPIKYLWCTTENPL